MYVYNIYRKCIAIATNNIKTGITQETFSSHIFNDNMMDQKKKKINL